MPVSVFFADLGNGQKLAGGEISADHLQPQGEMVFLHLAHEPAVFQRFVVSRHVELPFLFLRSPPRKIGFHLLRPLRKLCLMSL